MLQNFPTDKNTFPPGKTNQQPLLKVLFITYYWPPSGGAGVQRCLKFVKHLPEFNVEPTVVTVSEHEGAYPLFDNSLLAEVPENVRVFRTATSEPFEYYKKLTGKKEIPYGGFANEKKTGLVQKLFKFLRGNLFIPDARVGWNKHALKKCAELLETEKFDAVITSSPPHSTQLIGLELQKKYGLRWIADLRDPWTDIYYYKDLNHTFLAKKLDEKYEREVIQKADALLVTSADTKRLFLNKPVNIDSDKIMVLPNGFDEADFQFPSEPPNDRFCLTYTGTITDTYNIVAFLQAFAENARRYPEIKFSLRFVGKVSAEVQKQVEDANLVHLVEYVPFVPHVESIQYLMRSTALLMAIPDVENNFCILPGKLFEYLASNKQIICIGPVGSDADRIIDECGAGRVFHYSAYDLMLDHLDTLSRNWKVNYNLDLPNINYQHYSRKALTGKLADLIRTK
ncbi:glycosyltransferase family 4 protein [Adhaeribacter soli]|uniref:Glycosyltransferase family 4 protein n=1 Tax=Adhaeribacter soli TaxID=2607655 RepID=A0A5N1J4I2_9BACT|nr:glycosyltransferase family 4 protein [Adhaeribacter soli]